MDTNASNAMIKSAKDLLLHARREAVSANGNGPHSLEHVALLGEVEYINDSKSTFLDATLASIASVGRPVVWISAGIAAETGTGKVHEFLKDHVAALVVFGTEADAGIASFNPFTPHVYFAEELRTAVFLARELVRPGEAVLFSPAAPSAPAFANYEERGAEFRRAVRDL